MDTWWLVVFPFKIKFCTNPKDLCFNHRMSVTGWSSHFEVCGLLCWSLLFSCLVTDILRYSYSREQNSNWRPQCGQNEWDCVRSPLIVRWDLQSDLKVIKKSVCSQFAVEWGQIDNEMQSVCDNTVTECDKLSKMINLLTFRPEPQIWNRNSSTNSHVAAARGWFNCKMTLVLDNLAFI